MVELIKNALTGQFDGALAMINACVLQCPEDRWEGHVGNFPFWHVAYHTLYYADLYLSRDEDSFNAPCFHRENYQFFGRVPWPPHEAVVADVPFDKNVIREYVQDCRRKVSQSIAAEPRESLEGPCGFWWYKLARLEFHINNIRHIQHHAAQLSLYLRRSAGIEIHWVGSGVTE